MSNKLLDYKKEIEKSTYELWKGNGADIGNLNGVLSNGAQIILDIAEQLGDEDRLTTINYIKNAFFDFEKACNRRDDFMLADCLYFEWREIFSIYADTMGD